MENDSLNILGIKLDDGDTLDKGVPADERDIKHEGLIVLGSDLLLGLWYAEGVFCPDVGGDVRVEERIGILLLLLRRICAWIVGNLRSCDIDMSSWVSDRLDESSSSSSLFISSLGVKSISKYISS